ncbi:hypothetical protein [Clostridium aciditolerans]|uniref:Uncharacterized protein n=1 Tax=Clostridium aciditolerans TaxID=339861 RepID=A0A934I097_9CLOT|nr:hypothetical protein [Clostridium aciditolerans]MBI6873983.1 hypothetical protein [Clostridium aciditolerans]
MKLKFKTLALSALIIMGATTTTFASRLDMGPGQTGTNETLCNSDSIPGSHRVGINRRESQYGTCGLSYVGFNGRDLFTQVDVGGRTLIGTGTNWAQSETMCVGSQAVVRETHGLH